MTPVDAGNTNLLLWYLTRLFVLGKTSVGNKGSRSDDHCFRLAYFKIFATMYTCIHGKQYENLVFNSQYSKFGPEWPLYLFRCIHTKRKWPHFHVEFGKFSVLLVSTYVVCERLSVMHEPAGVVENLVQNSESAPLSEEGPLPRKLKFSHFLALEDFSVLTCRE